LIGLRNEKRRPKTSKLNPEKLSLRRQKVLTGPENCIKYLVGCGNKLSSNSIASSFFLKGSVSKSAGAEQFTALAIPQ